jgi:hypothetical protein
MDDRELEHAYKLEQIEARLQDIRSGDPAAFDRHLTRIRQRPDGDFEQCDLDGNWFLYLSGGWPYGAREVDALRARGDTITEHNVLVRYP